MEQEFITVLNREDLRLSELGEIREQLQQAITSRKDLILSEAKVKIEQNKTS